MSEVLAKEPKSSLWITYPGDDPEANTYARDLGAVFPKNGWRVGFIAASSAKEVIFGLRIPVIAHPDVLPSCITARKAISQAGIEYTNHPIAFVTMAIGSGDAVTHPCTNIFVGSKPLLKLDRTRRRSRNGVRFILN
jgi:hypothetical protein